MPDTSAREMLDCDPQLVSVFNWFFNIPVEIFDNIFRSAYDQIYDGIHTGRYRWNQLCKTEKTHFGTLIEIGIQRKLHIPDGDILDYKICGQEVDCKFSQNMYSWMIPEEAYGHICLLCHAIDNGNENSNWSIGLMRIQKEDLGNSRNKDKKGRLSENSQNKILWIHKNKNLTKNTLLCLPEQIQNEIFQHIDAPRMGQNRINKLFRLNLNTIISRNAILTVAKQEDSLKRVRDNGGARNDLSNDGIIILNGKWESNRSIARDLGIPIPGPSEFIATKVVPANENEPYTSKISGSHWRVDVHATITTRAPKLPKR